MSLQPNAYGRFEESWNFLAAEWAADVLDFHPPGPTGSLRHDVAPWVTNTPKDLMRASLCPEYVIRPANLQSWLDPAWTPPPVKEIIEDESLLDLRVHSA
jgi:hypothetical protein